MKTRLLAIVSSIWFALLQPMLAFAQQSQEPAVPQYPPMNWPYHGHMWSSGWGFWWGGPMMMLGLIVVCIIIFMLGRRSGADSHQHHHGPWHMTGHAPRPDHPWGDPTYSALQILNARFARGEIQKQEYEEKKVAILSSGLR